MTAYYNEIDPYAAAWLRNLIAAGLIAPGDVDERSIVDVQPDDLRGYTQCHFFAGIGGWSYAARLAGWPDDRPLWTGSCPCQGESAAGKRLGKDDPRHLWPAWFPLIAARRPPIVMGEQVARAAGTHWLDGVCADLESINYAARAVTIQACAIGAPHERDRLWFVTNPVGRQHGNEISGRYTRDEKVAEASANRHEARPADGQVEPRVRAAEVTLDRCAVLETWQSWNGGFGGFGRLDDGVSKRVAGSVVGGFGNAIVPQVAAEVIGAYLDAEDDLADRRRVRLGGVFD